MKRMFTVLAAALVVASASAQKEKNNPNYTEKWSDNIFLSVGGGGQVGLKSENYNDGFWRAVNPHVYIGVGKYINPLWSYRIEANGWKALDKSPNKETRNFIGANVDAIYNLTNAFLGYNPDKVFELSVFGGPGATFSKGISINPVVSAGLQAKFNFNKYLSLDIEGRMSGQREIVLKEQNRWYGTLTAGLTYTFGGKKFANCSKHDLCLAEQQRLNDQINADKSQISDLENQLAAAKRAANKPVPVAPTVTKDCEPTAGPIAIFFEIGKWKLNARDKANIQLASKAIKADPNGKYSVYGYTDKATGSAKWNLKLSELRAKTVYDALVSEGVDPSQLEQKGMGEQANMFTSNALNRVVIVKRK